MTHIGIDARLTHYRVGGISTYTRRLIEALEEHLCADFRRDAARCIPAQTTLHFTVFQSHKSGEPITQRFNTAKLWTPPHHRFERFALSVELLRFKLDLLHSPDFIPPFRGARKHVITVHDLTFLHDPQHKDRAAQRYYNAQIEAAVRHADHILSVSEATKQDLVEMLHIPPDKITVQPHGVDPRFHPMTPDEHTTDTARLNLPKDYILFVGTLEPRKNIPALLNAYAELYNAPPLLLVGRPGWLFDDIMTQIKTMQAQGFNIMIRSDITDDQLPIVYNQAKVLVLPAFYEGFGMPALEAMACGTPVIVSNTSSLPEVVGDAGLLINPHDPSTLRDALERGITDTEWAQIASERGLERARRFTWENSARIALSVYTQVLERL